MISMGVITHQSSFTSALNSLRELEAWHDFISHPYGKIKALVNRSERLFD